MVLRAAIVLLAVLNLGAAAWWVLHAPPPPAPPPAPPPGAARLHLLADGEAAAPAVAAATPRGARDAVSAPPPPAAAAAPAPAAVRADAIACEGGDGPAAGWRVYLPGLPSADAAQATAARIGAAGFTDYLVVREGDDANTIALGRYGSEAAAQRRTASLRAAGFPARCARIAAATPA